MQEFRRTDVAPTLSRWIGAACLSVAVALAGLSPATPAGAEEVDLELVLAVDVSFSMDEDEQRLQRLGYVEAILSAEVLAAIKDGIHGKIAIAYMEWAGAAEQRVVVDWQVISDRNSAEAFTAKLGQQPIRRVFRTSISEALSVATDLIAENGYEGIRKVIDVSGDGPNNQGRLVTTARDRAVEAGITINGLPLMLKRSANSYFDLPNLDAYYHDVRDRGERRLPRTGARHRGVRRGGPPQARARDRRRPAGAGDGRAGADGPCRSTLSAPSARGSGGAASGTTRAPPTAGRCAAQRP